MLQHGALGYIFQSNSNPSQDNSQKVNESNNYNSINGLARPSGPGFASVLGQSIGGKAINGATRVVGRFDVIEEPLQLESDFAATTGNNLPRFMHDLSASQTSFNLGDTADIESFDILPKPFEWVDGSSIKGDAEIFIDSENGFQIAPKPLEITEDVKPGSSNEIVSFPVIQSIFNSGIYFDRTTPLSQQPAATLNGESSITATKSLSSSGFDNAQLTAILGRDSSEKLLGYPLPARRSGVGAFNSIKDVLATLGLADVQQLSKDLPGIFSFDQERLSLIKGQLNNSDTKLFNWSNAFALSDAKANASVDLLSGKLADMMFNQKVSSQMAAGNIGQNIQSQFGSLGSLLTSGTPSTHALTGLGSDTSSLANSFSFNPLTGDASDAAKSQLLSASSSLFGQGLNLKRGLAPNLAMRIQWMFNQALSSAEVMMDPPELGPMNVKIQQTNGETQIMFQVNNAQTKEAIESSLDKLRAMLEEQGILLADAQVEQHKKQNEQKKVSSEGLESEMDLDVDSEQDDKSVQSGIIDSIVDVYT